MKPRYPLESLRSLRHHRVEERATAVAEQAERTRRARRRCGVATAASTDEQERNQRVVAAERDRLERGLARAEDLQWQAEWSRAAAEREKRLQEQEEAAVREMRAAERLEEELRSTLVHADADAKVVDTHRDRWQAAETKRSVRVAEEAADELHQASLAGERIAVREREGKR